MVIENELHIQQSNTIMKMQEQIKGLENRLSRAQDMIAELEMQLSAINNLTGTRGNENTTRVFKQPAMDHVIERPSSRPCNNCKNKCTRIRARNPAIVVFVGTYGNKRRHHDPVREH